MDPLLSPPAEFDFGAFLRDDTAGMDLDLDLDLDAAPPADRSSDSPTDSSPHARPSSDLVRAAKARHERRGHTKSRRGCFNCKRRRIKVSSLDLPGGKWDAGD